MTPNFYHTKLPFFQCISFANQPELQIQKAVAKFNEFKGVPNPKNWYPEFVFNRPWTSEAPGTMNVKVWNMDTDTQHVDFGILPMFGSLFQHYQAIIEGTQKIVTMFTGIYDPVTTMPSGNYQYRITIGAYRFYSEIWTVCNLDHTQQYHKHFTRISYNATCNFANIRYESLPNLVHHLYLPSEAILPESQVEEENQTNSNEQIVSSHQKITKLFKLACPSVTEAMVDAVNSLTMYTNGEGRKIYALSRSPYSSKKNILDIQVEKPDYSNSEVCPILRFAIQIDPMIVSQDCCDSSEIVSFLGSLAPPPTISKVNSTTIKVQKPFTFGNWQEENKIPAWCLVRLQYSLNSGAWVQLPTVYTYLQIAASVNVSGLAAGSYVFRMRIETISAGTNSNWSNNSNAVVLP